MSVPAGVGRPGKDEYAPYYERYVAQVPVGDLLGFLKAQGEELEAVLGAVPAEREGYRYAEGKWSIREVVGHVIDAERVFAYRALAFGRGSTAALPGMDEVPWAAGAGHDRVPLAELLAELTAVRAATLAFFRHLPQEAWGRSGVASGAPVTVRALGFIIAGHAAHHLGVLAERYGVARPR